jgi:uncharacterized protein
MSPDDNRKAALAYFNKIVSGDIDGAMAMLADDATTWIPDRGTMTKAQTKELFSFARTAFKSNPVFKAVGTTAEGNRVALECELTADLNSGKRYENKYHVLFVFDGPKIKTIREYTDTVPAQKAFS